MAEMYPPIKIIGQIESIELGPLKSPGWGVAPDIVNIRTEDLEKPLRLLLLDQRAPRGCVDPATLPKGCKVELTYKKVFFYILEIKALEDFEPVVRRAPKTPPKSKPKGLMGRLRG